MAFVHVLNWKSMHLVARSMVNTIIIIINKRYDNSDRFQKWIAHSAMVNWAIIKVIVGAAWVSLYLLRKRGEWLIISTVIKFQTLCNNCLRAAGLFIWFGLALNQCICIKTLPIPVNKENLAAGWSSINNTYRISWIISQKKKIKMG